MASYLTTRQLQDILQVDRTTIYRMADSGRIPAVKVGNQWRFPQSQVEAWLKVNSGTVAGDLDANGRVGARKTNGNLARLLPVDCVQQIQDTFADALGVMVVVADLDGQPLTRPSNPFGLFDLAEDSPVAHRRCIEAWAKMATDPSMRPVFVPSPLGLLCARGLIRVGSEIRAMLVVGGIAPPSWPPDKDGLQKVADYLELDIADVTGHANEVFYMDDRQQEELLPFVQRIADIVAHIITERKQLFDKLESISELSRV
jgi:excisionase family DNA binding protein